MTSSIQGTGRRLARLVTLASMVTVMGAAQAADKVVVGALRFTSHAGGFIAHEKGYFKDAGLDVSFS